MRASIWFARTAGEGGRGIERARARPREGVRVVRAVEEAVLSLVRRDLLAEDCRHGAAMVNAVRLGDACVGCGSRCV